MATTPRPRPTRSGATTTAAPRRPGAQAARRKGRAGQVVPDAFRVIAEYTYDWETWVDQTGRTQWINSAVERITGYSVAWCMARKTYPLVLAHPADRKRLADVLARAAAGEAGNDEEFRVRCKNGRVRWVAVSWQSMKDSQGRALGYRTSMRDIDDRKRLERQMDGLRRRAEHAAQARSELLANVSHELRSPAHCIAGFADLLAGSTLTQEQQRHVRVIADQAHMMQRQVEDLLQVAALDVGALKLAAAPFDLRALLDSLVDALILEAKHKPAVRIERVIALTTHAEGDSRGGNNTSWVIGDRTRVGQIVRNLLDNALKFTNAGTIELRVQRERDGQVLFEVRDTGLGMTAAQVRKATSPFFQVDARSVKRYAGVGLGLSIVERLVAGMGGRLELSSQRRRGTSARVLLPLAPTAAPAPSPPRMVAAQQQTLRVLIVDDSPAARALMEEWLAAQGHPTVSADGGRAAIAAFKRSHFDVVLLDYQMPGMDGAETARRLRALLKAARAKADKSKRRALRQPLIVLTTANAFVRDQLQLGDVIDQVLVKPIARADLIAVLDLVTPDAPHERPFAHDTHDTMDALLDRRAVQELLAAPSSKAANLLLHLLPATLAEQAEALADARAALTARDVVAYERACHRVAGGAAAVGARAAASHARAMMDAAARTPFKWKAATSALRELETLCERSERLLRAAALQGERVSPDTP